jgi:hypothetical protein
MINLNPNRRYEQLYEESIGDQVIIGKINSMGQTVSMSSSPYNKINEKTELTLQPSPLENHKQ